MTLALEQTELPFADLESPSDPRFILAQLGDLQLVFPTHSVTEILVVERAHLLSLPFYNASILGCIHHAGRVVPLIATDQLLQTKARGAQERLTIIYLSQTAEQLAGVGFVVERILGSKSANQLPTELFEPHHPPIVTRADQSFWLFEPHDIDHKIWEPQYWQQQSR